MKIEGFEDGLSVDAVPAVPAGEHWRIPQTDAARVKNQWEPTDPERLGELTSARNAASPVVNGRGSYDPMVKLIRQVRSHHVGDDKPSSLYFEFLAYWAFEQLPVGFSYAELLAVTLDRVATRLESGVVVTDPAMGTPYTTAPTDNELRQAGEAFRGLAKEAAAALTMERCPGAAAWRRILGRNPRGAVFPLPAGCDETGKAIGSVVANRDTGSDESRRFA